MRQFAEFLLKRTSVLAAALVIGGAIASAPALAVSGGGASDNDTPKCKSGFVWKDGKCVKAGASLLDDKQLYTRGRDLALAGRYDEALTALHAVKNKNDAMVLTMIGYSERKLGNVDEGIAYYHRALAIDPKNLNTHEYLGEGYVAMGRKDLAEAELKTLEQLCGTTDCEQYVDLASAIVGNSGDWVRPVE